MIFYGKNGEFLKIYFILIDGKKFEFGRLYIVFINLRDIGFVS